MAVTTTSVGAAAVAGAYLSRIAYEGGYPMARLLPHARYESIENLPTSTMDLWKWPALEAAGFTEGTDETVPTSITPTANTATPVEVGLYHSITNKMLRDGAARRITDWAEQAGKGCFIKKEKDLGTAANSFTTNVNRSGASLTTGDVLEAITAARNGNMPDPMVAYLDMYALLQVNLSRVSQAGVELAPAPPGSMGRYGMAYEPDHVLGGVPIVGINVAYTSSSDKISFVAPIGSANGIAYVEDLPLTTLVDPDITLRAVEIVVYSDYHALAANTGANGGVKITSKQGS